MNNTYLFTHQENNDYSNIRGKGVKKQDLIIREFYCPMAKEYFAVIRNWELSEGLSEGVPWTFGGTGNWELGIGNSSDLAPGTWRLAPCSLNL